MYILVVSAALLCLLSLSQATLEDCKEIIKPLILEDDNKSIMGKWIFLEGISDHSLTMNILKNVNSSWMEIGPSSLLNTLTLSQGNMINSECQFSAFNTTIKDSTFYANHCGFIIEFKLLPTCPGCLTLRIIYQMNNVTINSFYFFKRESNPTESDMNMYWKQAECLGFKRQSLYSYDGVTEFCHEAKNN